MPLPAGTLLNINCPAGEARGRRDRHARQAHLSRRAEAHGLGEDRGRSPQYWIYGPDPGFHEEAGTDFAAIGAGHIAVTPLHFDLTDVAGWTRS